MTRAQSFKALAGQSFMDRMALVTLTPTHSLDHQPSVTPYAVMDDETINQLLTASRLVRPQAL